MIHQLIDPSLFDYIVKQYVRLTALLTSELHARGHTKTCDYTTLQNTMSKHVPEKCTCGLTAEFKSWSTPNHPVNALRYICIDSELLAQTIYSNTDASLADARHIIRTALATSDDEVYRASSMQMEQERDNRPARKS